MKFFTKYKNEVSNLVSKDKDEPNHLEVDASLMMSYKTGYTDIGQRKRESERKREREIERERERKRERDRDRQIERQIDRQIDRERDRQIDRERERDRIKIEKQTNK